MANGLYNASGVLVPFSSRELSSELATRQNAGLTLDSVGFWLDQLPDPDPILRNRGEDAAVLANLYADDQVTSATLSRKNRVLNAPLYGYRAGVPEGETVTPNAQLVYERLAQDLERTNLRALISSILDAPFYGMTPLELIWKPGGGWWHLTDIIARPFHWFKFDTNNQPLFCGFQGMTYVEPVPLPVGKFVIVNHHATYDNPYGLRLLSRCLWPVAFKRGGLQFYAKFVERHGMPWVIANAPAGAEPAERRAIANDLSRMIQDCVAALSAGSEVKFIEAGSGQDMTHERFLARQDKTISKLLMGQTLTMEMEGKNNSQAAATTHGDVAEDLALSDKAMVMDAFNEIAWIYTQVNMGNKVIAPIFTYEEPEDLLERAKLDKELVGMGVTFTANHFKEKYNLKDDEFSVAEKPAPANQEASANPEAPADPEVPASFSTAQTQSSLPASLATSLPVVAQATLDATVKKLLPEAIKTSAEFTTELENLIRNATSFDDFGLGLSELLAPRMQPSAFEAFLAQTMTAVAGFGATAVNAEIKAGKDDA